MRYTYEMTGCACSDGVLSDGVLSDGALQCGCWRTCRSIELPLYPVPTVPRTGGAEWSALALILLGTILLALRLRGRKKA